MRLQRRFDEVALAQQSSAAEAERAAAELRGLLKLKTLECEQSAMMASEHVATSARLTAECTGLREKLALLQVRLGGVVLGRCHHAHTHLRSLRRAQMELTKLEAAADRDRRTLEAQLQVRATSDSLANSEAFEKSLPAHPPNHDRRPPATRRASTSGSRLSSTQRLSVLATLRPPTKTPRLDPRAARHAALTSS